MSEFKCIDLREFFNHKLFYSNKPDDKDNCGIDNIYIETQELGDQKEILGGVEFVSHYGGNDNIVCENQKIRINSNAKSIHFLGFSYWGETNELIKILYEDNGEEYVNIPFMDWNRDFCNVDKVLCGDNMEPVKTLISSGDLIHLVHFHRSKVDLKGKNIDAIILPDNMLLHIFAITIEK